MLRFIQELQDVTKNHKPSTKSRGNQGEDIASSFLISKGYTILTKNFHSRFGEIDIIATFGSALVFIEVKTRWSAKFGSPVEAVTPWKLVKIRKTGEYYSLLNPNLPKKLLIEVVSIDLTQGSNPIVRLISTY